MNTRLFEIAESAVSPQNIFISLIIMLVVSFLIGIIFGSLSNSLKTGSVGSILTLIIYIIIFYSVKDKVQTERFNRIEEVMLAIDHNNLNCITERTPISDWKSGLVKINKCPTNIGYYLKTCDFLEKEKDYESAAFLLEVGLDFIDYKEDIPVPICQRLQKYYKILKNKPSLNENCLKVRYL